MLNAIPPETRRRATAAYMADPQDTATPRGALAFLSGSTRDDAENEKIIADVARMVTRGVQ